MASDGRRIFNALGEAEGTAIGAAEIAAGRRQELAATITGRAAAASAAGVRGG